MVFRFVEVEARLRDRSKGRHFPQAIAMVHSMRCAMAYRLVEARGSSRDPLMTEWHSVEVMEDLTGACSASQK